MSNLATIGSQILQKSVQAQLKNKNPATQVKPLATIMTLAKPAPGSSPAALVNLSTVGQAVLARSPSAINAKPAASLAPVNVSVSMGASTTLGYDQQASTSRSLSGTPTNQVNVTVSLVQGVTYTIGTGYSYSYLPGTSPSFSLTAKNASNQLNGSFTSSPSASPSGTFTATTTGNYTLTLSSSNASLTSFSMQIYAKAKLPSSSGDSNVDALLQGSNSWWHNAGTAPAQGTSIINGALKALAAGSSATSLTYGFLNAAPTSASTNDKSGFQAITNANEKAAVQSAFNFISSITKLTFTEVDSSTGAANDSANINFGSNLQTTSDGYAYTPNNSPALGKTYVYINNKTPSDLGSFTDGSYGWSDVYHEIGHALGLKHPGNYNAGLPGNTTGTPPFLPTNTDNHQYSIMSYNNNTYTQGVNNSTYMTYDIEALQYLYGVKANSSTATSGSFNFTNSTPSTSYLKTLWSNTGSDQINLTGMSNASIVNLNAGSYSSINIRSNTAGQNNVGIAYGSKINTVTLSTTSAADKVVLNNAYTTGSFDVINNLTSADKIDIKTALFGALSSGNIAIGGGLTSASNANTKLIVNSTTGDIYYDADGNGSAAHAIKVAHYSQSGSFTLSASNFEFVA